ncbi:MAG: alpha/beta hydrolase [Haloferula sp.]
MAGDLSEMDQRASLEIGASREEAELSVILMHGLGADGHDFADVAAMLCEAARPRRWRFVLPHAESIPVTINMGMTMPAWYDILDLSHPRSVNWETVAHSQARIEGWMNDELAPKLVLAGFSQGGAMALHVGLRNSQRIAGVLMMSGYLLESDDHPLPPGGGDLPIRVLHGRDDEVVPITAAEEAVRSLENSGRAPAYTSFDGLGHSVCDQEVREVFEWLAGVAGD